MLKKNEYHPDQYAEYLANHHRHNAAVNILDWGFYMFGMSLVSAAVVLPAFLKRLGASDIVIGLLPAVLLIGISLPQVFMSFHVEGKLRVKPWCLLMGIIQRLPWLAMGFFTLLLAESNPGLLIWLFVICYLITSLAYGFAATAHGELIGKAIPPRRRGMFMGLGTVLSNAFGIIGGLYVKLVMESGYFSYPTTYVVLLFSCSALLWISYAFFAMNREPLLWPNRTERNLRSYFRSLPRILRNDHSFRRFIIAQIFGTGRVMGMAFFMVYAVERFDLSDTVTGNFVMTSTAAALLAALFLGMLSDRFGHKMNIALSQVLFAAATLAAIFAWNWRVMYLVFALMAMSIAAQWVSERNIIYQFAPEGKRPTYLALAATLLAPFILGFSLLGGWLAEHSGWGYHAPFTAVVVLNLVSLGIIVFGVKVPEIQPIAADRPAAKEA